MHTGLQNQAKVKLTPIPSFKRGGLGLLQRKCACGGSSGLAGECADCARKEMTMPNGPVRRFHAPTSQPIISAGLAKSGMPLDLAGHIPLNARFGHNFGQIAISNPASINELPSPKPAKALGESPIRGEAKPSPQQGSATIQCDGSGGFEIVYNGWAGATCGTKSCVTVHESSHITDWKGKWPTGCKGQPKGYLPKGDPPDNPLMTVDEYNAFLKKSECKAHTADLQCAKTLPKPAGCKKTVEDYISLTEKQRKNWCPSLSTGARVAIGAGGGALVGAGIGALAGGPIGAAVGAGVGAVVGGIAGFLF